MKFRWFACFLSLGIAAGCGRSSLLYIDNGCPPEDPFCVRVDASTDGRDAGRIDGGRDGAADGFRPDAQSDRIDTTDGCSSAPEICDNGGDDNCNGLADCQDPACKQFLSCLPKEICDNNIDDDGNGFTDCLDPICFGDRHCAVPGQEICNNNIDDDDDTLIDCADPNCMQNPVCVPNMQQEICDNKIDDNNNNLIDCADPQCVAFPACVAVNCKSDVDFGVIAAHDAHVTRTLDTRGATQTFNTCAPSGGKARVGSFELTETADVKLDFTQASGGAHVVAVYRAGALQSCDQNSLDCLQAGQAASASRTLPRLAAGRYWVIVQSYPGTQQSTTVTLSTATQSIPEICNNGVDDNGNGLIDCADLLCQNDANCTDRQCVADINIGALIVDGPAKPVQTNTNGTSNRYHPTCAGLSNGNDVTVSLTLPDTAGILVQWQQTGDHVIGLYAFPGPGLACDTTQQSCFYPNGDFAGAVAFGPRPAGRYVLIFKALRPNSQGFLNLRISAYRNRQIEICTNGIDDDGNNLTDCDDPACFGVSGCGAPLCQPDNNLGDIGWGTQKQVNLDMRGAPNLYQTTCGKGNGRERVIRFRLTQPMALGISCSQTGSHVLQLSQALLPLDACDAHNLNCADPAVLPFGCNFAMPNLQPGLYNLLVEAFQSGDEGTLNLALEGIEEQIREICNNGIDDDQDGATDCADRKCVTSPLCAPFACRPDQQLGLLALENPPHMYSVVAQTNGQGNDQLATCASAATGQDAVVDFELPGKADLAIDYAQVGNHVLALYKNDGALFACDAGMLQSCTQTMQSPTGHFVLSNVPAGKYHLVVDADHAGVEGGVVLQIAGTPKP